MHTRHLTLKAAALGLVLALAGLTATAAPPAAAAERDASPEMLQIRLNILNKYFEIVNAFHAVAQSPEKALVFNLQQLEENYKAQGKPDEVTKLYQRLLKDSRSHTLRNVAYMKLSEIYKRAGRLDEANALLQKAIEENMRALK